MAMALLATGGGPNSVGTYAGLKVKFAASD
jgi:hypothetical protein